MMEKLNSIIKLITFIVAEMAAGVGIAFLIEETTDRGISELGTNLIVWLLISCCMTLITLITIREFKK